MRVYMDNSATSFPKPEAVITAMTEYLRSSGASVSRSSSAEALAAGNLLAELREELAEFFGAEDSRNVVFTKNVTEALNIVIAGLIEKGDRVLVSSVEHNAVMRPLTGAGAQITAIPVSKEGVLDMDFAQAHIPSSKAVICTHVSNVSGDVLPVAALAFLCREKGVPFILDSAQSAGVLPIDMRETAIDALCFTGHKSLLGPTGTGGMILTSELARRLPPFIMGGTGSRSDHELHPQMMPDKFEAGTPNVVGLTGLHAALQYIRSYGRERIFAKEKEAGKYFFEKLSKFEEIDIIGSQDYGNKPPVFSLDFKTLDNAQVSHLLSRDYRIDNRCGLHCAPRAHQTYGTYPQGTLRLSLSHFTIRQEMDHAVEAISEILKTAR